MREILCRGKCKYIEDEWVYGVPIEHSDGDWQIISGLSNACVKTTVLPQTIGQYTGSNDKNDVKIFEGDIVEFDKYSTEISDNRYVIQYAPEFMQFIGVKTNKTHMIAFTTFDNDTDRIKVIGNIYDNPELIKDMELLLKEV